MSRKQVIRFVKRYCRRPPFTAWGRAHNRSARRLGSHGLVGMVWYEIFR